MIYLDYAANTPVDEQVLERYIKVNKKYIANPNGNHFLGKQMQEIIKNTNEEISKLLNIKETEIIHTSGASESNNLAIKGVARTQRTKGRHMITTCLEHASVSATFTWLQNQGYEIDLVDIESDGRVDITHLSELIREDTILVSIGYVDSELGVVQPIKEIGELIKDYSNCLFHTDATQAMGKIPLELKDVDLVTFAPHKFYGLNGMGVLLRKEKVMLEPLIHGGSSTSIYRSGTPVLSWVESTYVALKLSYEKMMDRMAYVKAINTKLRENLKQYKEVYINSTSNSLPHFLNISVKGIKAEMFQKALSEQEIYVSTKSACTVTNAPSRIVHTVTKDRKRARESWRISISHMTTELEIDTFLKIFSECYKQLQK